MSKFPIDKIFRLFKKGVAHRGLHDESHPENSKAAFERAIEFGLPFETDVHLTKDHQLILCHDSDLRRTTGKSGVIEELDYFDIKRLYRLKNGERLLSLEELIDLQDEKVPLVLELKTASHNEEALGKRLAPVLERIHDENAIVLISFDKEALRYFAPSRYNRGLLLDKETLSMEEELTEWEFLDVEYHALSDPRLLAYRQMGKKLMAWTLKEKEDYRSIKPLCDAVTFEDMDPKAIG